MTACDPTTIVVLDGDQTGQELLLQALRLLHPAVLRLPLPSRHFDLSLANRRQRSDNPSLTRQRRRCAAPDSASRPPPSRPADADDVASPNAILREAIDGQVILRTGRRLPNVRPVGGVHAPIAVVRMAVGDAYGAKEWREPMPDGDEAALRIERITRKTCRAVAEFAFQYAEQDRRQGVRRPQVHRQPGV